MLVDNDINFSQPSSSLFNVIKFFLLIIQNILSYVMKFSVNFDIYARKIEDELLCVLFLLFPS